MAALIRTLNETINLKETIIKEYIRVAQPPIYGDIKVVDDITLNTTIAEKH